jgi:diguanylate cyclase (GGDEF)-like protein
MPASRTRSTELKETHRTLNRLTSLTALPNHSAFQEFIRGEWYPVFHETSTISMLMIDVDRFTEHNDRLGSQAGSDCLVKITRKLK